MMGNKCYNKKDFLIYNYIYYVGGSIMVQSRNVSPNSDFSVSLVAPWVKGNIFVDDHFLRIDMQNTVLFGMIPAGRAKDTSPLNTLSNVYTSSSYHLGAIFLGAIIALAGLGAFGSSFFAGLILLLVGLAIAGSGIKTVFAYEKSGIQRSIELPFFEANHARELEEQVVQALAKFQDDRNVATSTAAITEAIRNK